MKDERLRQVSPIFHQALAISPDERAGFLEAACEGDAALRRDVERLISAHERAGSFIESPAYEKAAMLLNDNPTSSMVGQLLAHYKIVPSLGKGGMGEVYLARDTQLGRSVALKFLPLDVASDEERMRRFMITRDDYAKILDFGLAKLVEPQRASTSTSDVVLIRNAKQ